MRLISRYRYFQYYRSKIDYKYKSMFHLRTWHSLCALVHIFGNLCRIWCITFAFNSQFMTFFIVLIIYWYWITIYHFLSLILRILCRTTKLSLSWEESLVGPYFHSYIVNLFFCNLPMPHIGFISWKNNFSNFTLSLKGEWRLKASVMENYDKIGIFQPFG